MRLQQSINFTQSSYTIFANIYSLTSFTKLPLDWNLCESMMEIKSERREKFRPCKIRITLYMQVCSSKYVVFYINVQI